MTKKKKDQDEPTPQTHGGCFVDGVLVHETKQSSGVEVRAPAKEVKADV